MESPRLGILQLNVGIKLKLLLVECLGQSQTLIQLLFCLPFFSLQLTQILKQKLLQHHPSHLHLLQSALKRKYVYKLLTHSSSISPFDYYVVLSDQVFAQLRFSSGSLWILLIVTSPLVLNISYLHVLISSFPYSIVSSILWKIMSRWSSLFTICSSLW